MPTGQAVEKFGQCFVVGRLFRPGETLLSRRAAKCAAARLPAASAFPFAVKRFTPSLRDRSGFRDVMPQKVRIALDAMGGDVGAAVVTPGAAMSLMRHPDAEFLLFGDQARIGPELEKHPQLKAASRVIHTDVAVSMHDKPSQARRRGRKTSSMWLALEAVKKGEADVAVSAGNTGALVVMARFCLRTLDGIDRPALAGWHLPTNTNQNLAGGARGGRRARPRGRGRRRRAAAGRARGGGRRGG